MTLSKMKHNDHRRYLPLECFPRTDPETGQQIPVQVSNKVDVWSVGVILFELYHPFATQMERVRALGHLREHHLLPKALLEDFPLESKLISQLVSHPTLGSGLACLSRNRCKSPDDM